MIDSIVVPLLDRIGGTILGVLPETAALALAFTAIGFVASPCNPGTRWWRKPDLVTDVLFMFGLPLVTGYARVTFLTLGAGLLYGIATPAEAERFVAGGYGPLSVLPTWAQFAVYLVGCDLIMYGTHRAFHTMSLWRYHAIHHAPEHLDWTSASRFHPVNIILHSVLADTVLMLLGVSPQVLIALAPFNVAVSAFVHANLDWTLGPFRYVVASPVFHRWHHTDVERGGSMNFAPTFPIIDVIFGTFYMPEGELPDRFGVDDHHFPAEFVAQLLYPFRRTKPETPVLVPPVPPEMPA